MSINWKDFECKVSKYFTVGEVTNRDPRRIPTDTKVIVNILNLATNLDLLREEWGSPIRVTSWYRPYYINLSVGGVSNSQHINGGAADIMCTNGESQKFKTFVLNNWNDAVGDGIKTGKNFMHVDIRYGVGFEKGKKARLVWGY